jgi:hypothetical protein
LSITDMFAGSSSEKDGPFFCPFDGGDETGCWQSPAAVSRLDRGEDLHGIEGDDGPPICACDLVDTGDRF